MWYDPWLFLQIPLFILGSAGLVYVSRKSLRDVRSHGFYRFFAWEAILALVLLYLPGWFRDPFSWHQLLSWFLLIASTFLVVEGVYLLRKIGKSRGQVQGSSNYAFENTTNLVRTGLYKYIRHPLYASLLGLAWGVYLKEPLSLAGVVLVAAASFFLWRTARADETECLGTFGEQYREYMKETKMFIPWVL